MKTASVATAKNELSRLLRRVKRGESVVITDRNHPVACLQPYVAVAGAPPVLAVLYEAGVLAPPSQPQLDLAAFLKLPAPALPAGRNLVAAVLAEREESR